MQNLYVFYDLVAEAFIGNIMVARHDAPIIREFSDLCANPQTIIGKHPDNFEVRSYGKIDEEGGIEVYPLRVVYSGVMWQAINSEVGQ